ncbi:peptidoglycan editing factor PgeF [Frankia sp. CNm7]|uniref:Purine nucleoside phosphorylase n=1 Tax=Frankia nepalensis TaxID=1836974 RepID=A0A937RH12_9ACTN|nr:peptidoglycan editing factor PgeF [Frankia nepalensis]MBL7500365.1 peptidoglycan editing factor PgeF [Frankia nepalensis]MBL7508663.1 peptidoglycan editing factor PgeF [Frankia nepalensis]MBL7522990.1 peptidoglycan editing factor PgeF [Frankia nepalensis]MBL7628825.1 peptidoglycan editing factor PgeF [Frankia nepalensis]
MPLLFTERAGGVSTGPYASLNLGGHVGDDPEAVATNRRRLTVRAGVPVHFTRQVHGARVLTFSAAGGWLRHPAPEADAMVTDIPGFGLGVLVADCVPVVFTAPGAAGVAHAGRAGLAAGVVPATVAALAALGAEPGQLHAEVGPSVCGRCYEVPAAMRDDVAAAVPGTASTTRAGTPALDLRAGVAAQLRAAGVTDITVSERCTMEDPELFSHRRDGARTGRFAGVAWL